jgi:5-methylcytosine-specific restriction endonuclease McrA
MWSPHQGRRPVPQHDRWLSVARGRMADAAPQAFLHVTRRRAGQKVTAAQMADYTSPIRPTAIWLRFLHCVQVNVFWEMIMRVVDQDTGEEIFLDSTSEFKADFESILARCVHPRRELRQKTNRGGAVQYIDQCLDCGDSVGMFQKHSPKLSRSPAWDDQIQTNYIAVRENQKSEIIQKHVRIQRNRTEGFWKRYKEYLESDEWAQKRLKILKRAKGQCEGCGERRATQVHHLTYEHAFKEFLFELVAVCGDCHAALHAKNVNSSDQDLQDFEREWSDGFPCDACRYSTEEGDRKWCGKFDVLAAAALTPDGDCGPYHKELEPLK